MSLIKTFNDLRDELRATQARLDEALRETSRLETMARHFNFLDNFQDGYCSPRSRTRCSFLNLSLLRHLGYEDAERPTLLGKPLPADHWEEPLEFDLLWLELLRVGRIDEQKLEMRARNGASKPFKISGALATDEAGRPAGGQFVLRYVPLARRQGTAELRAENRELSALSTIGRNALSTMDSKVVVQHLLHTVRAVFKVEAAWVFLTPSAQAAHLAAHIGLSPIDLAEVEGTADAYLALVSDTDRHTPHCCGGEIPRGVTACHP